MWCTHVGICLEEVVRCTHADKCLEDMMWSPCRQMFRGGVVHPCRQCLEEVVWCTYEDICLEEVEWCTHADKCLGGGMVYP